MELLLCGVIIDYQPTSFVVYQLTWDKISYIMNNFYLWALNDLILLLRQNVSPVTFFGNHVILICFILEVLKTSYLNAIGLVLIPLSTMNPTATHNTELKSANYSLVSNTTSATTGGSTSDLLHLGQQRPPSYGPSGGNPSSGTRFHDATSTAVSFAPLVTVDTTGGTDYHEYFPPTAATSTIPSSFNPPSTFSSHHSVQSSYASLISDSDLYAGRQIPQPPHLTYMNSVPGGTAPSLQRFIGGLTNKLPDLQCVTGGGNIDAAYSTSHMVGLGSSSHASLISPAYSPSSVTTQGSGGGGGGNCKRAVLEADSKPGAFKSRSKKESHNRSTLSF